MKLIGIAATMLLVTLAVAGCKNRKQEPIPGPRAAQPAAGAPQQTGHPSGAVIDPGTTPPPGARRHGASGISWFQGGVEEAFSCPKCTVMLWHGALDR